MGKLKLLHVTAPAEFGGLESVVAALTAGHAARGHDVSLASVMTPGGREPSGFRNLEARGVRVIRLRIPARSYLAEFRALAALCAELRPDVMHTHGYRSDMIGLAVCSLARVSIMATVHGFTGSTPRTRLWEYLQTRAFRHMAAVVAVSRPMQDRLIQQGVPEGRIRLIQNAWFGGSTLVSRVGARQRLGVEGDVFHIGWVGRLSAEKGPDVMLHAVAALKKRGLGGRRLVVSIIGEGPKMELLKEQAAALGISKVIKWHGAIDDASELFPAFDAFALSSRTEGTPMVLFEAMAARVAIAATMVGGVPDVLSEDTAFLVPTGDAGALAQALKQIAQAPSEASRRTRRAHKMLGERFAAGAWLDDYEMLYQSIRKLRR